ncbi:MAG: nucleoside monophosphate kinase [Patescibacteria group bacterium]
MIPPATTFVFLGRSGCGKGTQVEFLKQKSEFRDAVEMRTGDIFRALAKNNTLLGRKVGEVMNTGGLIPMWITSCLWVQKFNEIKGSEILIFEGGPRWLEEAKLLDEASGFLGRPKAVAVLLEVSAEESRRRLRARKRADDTDERITNRLAWYQTNVIPEIEYFRSEGRLIEVNGENAPEAVCEEIWNKLQEYFK